MSIYSQNITTEIVRASYHNNSRTIFKMPPKVCLSNIRILNVGASVDAVAVGNNCKYPITSGAKCLVQSIALLGEDNQEICVLRNAHQFCGFENALHPNDEEADLIAPMVKASLGFKQNTDHKIGFTENQDLTADVNTTPKGMFYLADMLKYLADVVQVPCDLAPMRVVIEWSDDLKNFAINPATPVASFQIAEPQLVVDVIESAKSPADYQVSYYSMEQDRAVVQATASGLETNFKLSGFNGKFVNRMLMLNDTRTARQYTGMDKSTPMVGEALKIKVNGGELPPITEALKQKVCADAWGQNNFPVGDNLSGMKSNDIYQATQLPQKSFGYGGVQLATRVNELQMNFTRAVAGNAEQDDAFDFRCYAEVLKSMRIKNGNLVIGYN